MMTLSLLVLVTLSLLVSLVIIWCFVCAGRPTSTNRPYNQYPTKNVHPNSLQSYSLSISDSNHKAPVFGIG